VDYCSTTAGASLVAYHSPQSSKIVACTIPSGSSVTRRKAARAGGVGGILRVANHSGRCSTSARPPNLAWC
jgi:hypothetical protein